MPCDTRYVSTPIRLDNADRSILHQALEADGWTVALRGSTLVATLDGATLTVPARGAADLRTSQYSGDPRVLQARVLQAYGKRATVTALSRFGFRTRSETRTTDGTIVLTLGR